MKDILISAGLVIALLLGGIAVMQKSPEPPFAAQSVQVTDGNCFVSPSGFRACQERRALVSATTTVCSVRNTTNSTTTIAHASLSLTVSSSTASIVTIAKGSTPNASTTLLVATTLAANAQGTLVASTTSTGALMDGTNLLAPNDYLNFSMSGGTGTFSPTGICRVELVY